MIKHFSFASALENILNQVLWQPLPFYGPVVLPFIFLIAGPLLQSICRQDAGDSRCNKTIDSVDPLGDNL